jgi:hypothetical protein
VAGTKARERMVGPLTATASHFRQPQFVESFNLGPLCVRLTSWASMLFLSMSLQFSCIIIGDAVRSMKPWFRDRGVRGVWLH